MSIKKFVYDNSPGILAGVGVAGAVTAAYLSGRATFKAADILRRDWETSTLDRERTAKETFLLVWPLYIPAGATLLLTIAAIVGSSQIGNRRAAAVAAAYAISEKAMSEYKDKVVEKIGEKKERDIQDEIAQDRVLSNPNNTEITIVDAGDVLCYDMFSGRYFKSSMEALKKAQNDTNYQILNHAYASLSDFYARIGLSGTLYSEEVGWTSDHQVELAFSTVLSDDEKPCIAIGFNPHPVREYYRTY